ncbi:hypothetical protein [Aquimarina algiphila]|uniref:Uncharacterized protein n=1 Tax=Aquimarina algiphila TaxID=2047982 RepID=A0A554VID9_9FLAO|nr:hypothetical protein [Aquimarina algiphila]TSE07424.1 hypothetical protein FOF46_16030 [Aquimarina algiphila]
MTNTYETEITRDAYKKLEARTMVNNINDYDWLISTYKNDRGQIVCNAQACEETETGFSFVMFQDPSVTLCQVQKRATEKAIKEVHDMGLIEFDKLITSSELPTRSLSV